MQREETLIKRVSLGLYRSARIPFSFSQQLICEFYLQSGGILTRLDVV